METTDIVINGFGISSAILALGLIQKCPNIQIVICEINDEDSIFNGADLLKPSGISIIRSFGSRDKKKRTENISFWRTIDSFRLFSVRWIRLFYTDSIPETIISC